MCEICEIGTLLGSVADKLTNFCQDSLDNADLGDHLRAVTIIIDTKNRMVVPPALSPDDAHFLVKSLKLILDVSIDENGNTITPEMEN